LESGGYLDQPSFGALGSRQASEANLAKAPTDHWVPTYCREGATNVQTPKGEFDAAGGVPFLWSFGEEFESKRTRVERTQILMSRGAFHDLAPLLDAARGAPLEKPWGGCLATTSLPWSVGFTVSRD
jgi:hypothetical protein